MADAFQPKFVDLVRNYSTTTGTGDFVLGPAVNGYTGFAAACQVGDSFYYAALGVDKPAEREVGRGTLLANGRISRTPINGAKTNFTSGTKSIALIAAAEWHEQVQALVGSATPFGKALTASAAPGDARALLELTGGFNVKWFGAKGDAAVAADGTVSGSDDTAAIQAAIDHADSLGGGTVYFPEGRYRISGHLSLCKNLRAVGAGRKAACIVSDVGGTSGTAAERLLNDSAFYSGWPSNTSTPVHITVEHLGFRCSNPANRGAAFYDNCGTTVELRNCQVDGFKYGVVLDQTELADIDKCEFQFQNSGGAGVYLVNGPTFRAENLTTVTNRISVSRCQINQLPDVYGILDEGGYTHSFIDNNYNGCLTHLYLAGVQAFQVIGGEFEASTGVSIELEYRRVADLSGVGGSTGQFLGMLNATGLPGQPCIHITSVSGPISVRGCTLIRNDQGVPITGANNAGNGLVLSGNASNSASGELIDGYNAGNLFDDRIQRPVRTSSGVTAFALTRAHAEKFVRCTSPTANACTIQSDTDTPLPIGTTFYLEQSAAGPVTIAADAGVSLSGPSATNALNQRLVVRKRAANTWESRLEVQNPLTQAITPAAVAATGAVTTSAGGLGYAAGAGGAVNQATSKSTGVTLNKLCGQITMNAAALAASTTVSFTLTNNQIAAGDILVLSQAAGGTAGAYHLNAQTGPGTATINVRNLTAASLSEAITIGFAVVKAVTA